MIFPALDSSEEQFGSHSGAASSADGRVSAASMLPGLADLWQHTEGDPTIRVAVLDGPVDLTHSCFRGAELKRLPTMVPDSGMSEHGTHVTSLVFGQAESPTSPDVAVRGIAPRCTGLILPVFQQAPDGGLRPCSQQDLARNISIALEDGVHIINISGGELSSSGRGIDFLENAVRQAAERKVLIIAASGNDGCECLHVPAALPRVLPVGALDRDGRPLGSSNWSEQLEGLMAPGVMIEGALPGERVGWMTGTSFATPLVTGIAALLLSLQMQRGQEPDPSAVRRALLAGARPCDPRRTTDCRRWLRGSLDITGALNALGTDPVSRAFASSASAPTPPFQHSKGETMSDTTESHVSSPEANLPPVETGIEPSLCDNPSESLVQASDSEGTGSGSSPTAAGQAIFDLDGLEPSEDATTALAVPAGQLAPSSGARAFDSAYAPLVQASAEVQPSCQSMAMFSPFPPGQKAFTIGKLYYDFGTEARRDYFIAQIRAYYAEWQARNPGQKYEFSQGLIYVPEVMIKYLFGLDPEKDLPKHGELKPNKVNHLDAANALIWTVFIDQDPIYALVPEDQFAITSFVRLADFLAEQGRSEDPRAYRVAMAGTISGSITLFNGTVVPQMNMVTRGMFNWDIKTLVDATHSETGASAQEAGSSRGESGGATTVDTDLSNFLLRVYESLRNLGVTSEDRAKNFAATNTYQARQAFVWANSKGRRYKLDAIDAARSPICRRNSDCWDIKLSFFNPKDMFKDAR